MLATLARVRKVYGERAQVMADALKREMGDAVTFTQPEGGLFFWAKLTGAGGRSRTPASSRRRAIEQGVAFVPGAPFYATNPDASTFRLSFATLGTEKILEGGEVGEGELTARSSRFLRLNWRLDTSSAMLLSATRSPS
jgi:2-aminoadipate transaminase